MLVDKLMNCEALFRILYKTFIYEVFETWRPSGWNGWDRIDEDAVYYLTSVNIMVQSISCG